MGCSSAVFRVLLVLTLLVSSVALASFAVAESRKHRYKLKPGESITGAVTRHYGDKYYRWVLELHAGRKLRGRQVRLPPLRTILEQEQALARAPGVLEQVLSAQVRLRDAARSNWPSCSGERRWSKGARTAFATGAAELDGAIRAARKLHPPPRSLIRNLRGAAHYLRQLSTAHGGPLCKALLGAHKRFVYALQAAIKWSRRPPP
jgi:hypothetical protein